jgi:multiple sugar transport system permease protein
MSIWGGVGFSALILLAGLRNIPGDYYEAAKVDGASNLEIIRKITIPLLNPVITFVFITSLIGGFNVFASVYILTDGSGGPLNSTQVIVLQIFQNAFFRLWMGIATAMAFVLFAIVFGVTILQLRLRRSEEVALV